MVWHNPRFLFTDGSERPVGDLGWTSADARWDSAVVKEDASGVGTLRAQAAAVIEYAIPAGAVRFRAAGTVEKHAAGEQRGCVRLLTVVGTDANEDRRPGLPVPVALAELGITGPARVRDLWTHTDLGPARDTSAPVVPFHGARLYRLSDR